MNGLTASKPVMVAFGAAALAILAMALILVKYLFDTYVGTSIVVAVLATLLVVATGVIPCWVQRRRCARQEAQRSLSQAH